MPNQTLPYVGNWNDNAATVRDLAGILRYHGLKAKTGYSVYVGLRTLLVRADHVAKARKLLPQYSTNYDSDWFPDMRQYRQVIFAAVAKRDLKKNRKLYRRLGK
jgi:hypothetical protein